MDDTLTVLMGTAVAGTLSRPAESRLRFEYDDGYRAQSGATPLSLSMPLAIKVHADTASRQPVTNFLWGLLPDNEAVLERWARHYQVRLSSPIFLLGTPIGEDCAGAVSFCRPGDLDRMVSPTGNVTWLTGAEVAERIRDLGRDRTAWLGRDFTGQFSLAGAQAKTALLFEGGRWGLPSGSRATTHILKPESTGFEDHDLNEHLCLAAARLACMPAVTSSVERFEDQTALVLERYDRRVTNGAVIRVHQEDICQALGLHPSLKYQNQGGPSPAAIATLLRRAMPYSAAESAVQRFADALIWNWLIAGTDAHAKNYSVLLAGGDARLAPLYDMASILPYPGIHERKLRMAMKVGGEYDMRPSRNNWPKAAGELGLPTDDLVARVRHLAAIAPQAFADAAADPSVAAFNSPIAALLVDRVADRSRRCAEVVGPPNAIP
ncbi:MAG: type II toxin-antitoxin system HipA family toxin [Gemmatimonadaceae bacterium]|nr:type II toxin-antitoxin system HipA family toxin [Gemmatimonadaceae bacterium]